MRVSPASLEDIFSDLSAKYPQEIVSVSLEQLDKMGLIEQLSPNTHHGETTLYCLTTRGAEVTRTLLRAQPKNKE
jgi:sulfur transfer protein SufE